MRSRPDELIKDLRQAAEVRAIEVSDWPVAIPDEDLLENEAADWISAAVELIEQVQAAEGDMALTATELLAGDFPIAI